MTTTEYLLNIGILALVLATNLGTRTLTWRRLMVPVLLVALAGSSFLRQMPTLGHDLELELAGLSCGVLLGVVAALLVRVRRVGDRVVTMAGAGFAALWVVVIGGRMLFAYGAQHWYGRAIGEFSRTNQITGSVAWAAAFVLMALAMVISRVLVTGMQAARLGGSLPVAVR
jgi:hypothetical protein